MPHLPEMSQCLRLSKQHFSIFWKPISYPSDKFMQIGIISLSLSKFFPGISVQRYRLIIFIFLRFRLCYFPNLFNCFITCCLCLLPVDNVSFKASIRVKVVRDWVWKGSPMELFVRHQFQMAIFLDFQGYNIVNIRMKSDHSFCTFAQCLHPPHGNSDKSDPTL